MTTRCWLLTAVFLSFPVIAQAQDATVNGTVTDSTGGVLPGVTVTALHTTTGNTFFAVTDDRGNHENYNTYTLVETSPSYGRGADGSLARRMQLGFRVTF
jgi:hypothetical protein